MDSGADPRPVDPAPSRHDADQRAALVDLYDSALPEVYGYLYRRCNSAPLAEDLTSETFLAAADAVNRGRVPSLTVAWLITVARNKLVDHWRRAEREHRLAVAAVAVDTVADGGGADDWTATLDAALAREALDRLGSSHRSALTLRYLDGLSVPETASQLGRTVGATEVLLVRARRAFRRSYELIDGSGEG